ncbi:hypothetical protein [Streptomyces violascens]|uniref:hypothetical protein n=1 Tax=Streptomyces violascens TaxID=67381 RepID=UPI0036BC9ABC
MGTGPRHGTSNPVSRRSRFAPLPRAAPLPHTSAGRRTVPSLLVPAVSMVLLLAGCGTGSAGTSKITLPRGAEALVLRAQHYPSSPAAPGTPLPDYALYGDRKIYTPGPTTGALPGVRVQLLTVQAVERLYRRALSAGLEQARTYGSPAPDAPGLIVTLGAAGGTPVTRVFKPDPAEKGRRGDVARLAALTPDQLPPADRTGGSVPYAYSRLAVTAGIWGSGKAPEARPWPLGPLGVGEQVNGGSCTVLTGEDLDRARTLLTSARPDALWTSGNSTFRLQFRPLLPGERGCGDLKLAG